MRLSHSLHRTRKEVPKDAQIPSHRLMLRAGMIQQLASGIYSYLPLALRCIRKIEKIIREEMNRRSCEEVLMPTVLPAELWQESGRWDVYGDLLLRFKDRKGSEYCMGPTHEEIFTDMVRRNLHSWKQLPWNLYQIQGKFRDEFRPKSGLMRAREFIMKDGYSFDVDEQHAKQSYQLMYEAYTAIFRRCGMRFRAVDAATGEIGGNMSHEFQVLASTGEDVILGCSHCNYAVNIEKAVTLHKIITQPLGTIDIPDNICPQCEEGKLDEFRGIEVGHIFYLGTKYAEAMDCHFLDEKGQSRPAEMGCYGIGVGRTMAAAIEQNHDENGMKWPVPIAPWEAVVLPLQLDDSAVTAAAETIYSELTKAGIDVVIDDRAERPGYKFKDADLIGYPLQVVLGSRSVAKGMAELKNRQTGVKTELPLPEVVDYLSQWVIEARFIA